MDVSLDLWVSRSPERDGGGNPVLPGGTLRWWAHCRRRRLLRAHGGCPGIHMDDASTHTPHHMHPPLKRHGPKQCRGWTKSVSASEASAREKD